MCKETVRNWLNVNKWLITNETNNYINALSPIGLSVTFFFDDAGKYKSMNNSIEVTKI